MTTPDDGLARANGGVLRFTGRAETSGDLVAVNPDTGEERLLVEDLDAVSSARWSADGRWVAYEDDAGLWVVDYPVWSPDGSRIAVQGGSSHGGGFEYFAIDADGQGEAERIDELRYRSWDGGSYGDA